MSHGLIIQFIFGNVGTYWVFDISETRFNVPGAFGETRSNALQIVIITEHERKNFMQLPIMAYTHTYKHLCQSVDTQGCFSCLFDIVSCEILIRYAASVVCLIQYIAQS